MKTIPITDTFSVAAQPSVAGIEALAGGGTRLLINNRPDGEEPDQPSAAAEEAAAGQAGIGYLHLPVTGGTITRADVARFQQALQGADGPVIAHCRSGTRSLTLWVIGEVLAGRLARDEILAFGAQRGFDLAGARRWLDANDPR